MRRSFSEVKMAILDLIQTYLVHPALTDIMKFFTDIGEGGLIWLLFAVLLLARKETRRYGLVLAVALLLSLLFCNILLKNLVARPRPFTVQEIDLLIAAPGGYSFPSGHTSASFAGATVIWFWRRKWGGAAFVLAALIGFSRLYFYVHYPSDVLGGIFLGIGLGFLAWWLIALLEARLRGEDPLLGPKRR